MRRAIVRGTGHYLPERVIENSWFEDKLDTSDEWIRARTGIERRHFAAEDQRTSDLGILAGRAALENAGMTADQIDAVIVATSTPDLTFPSVATMVLPAACSEPVTAPRRVEVADWAEAAPAEASRVAMASAETAPRVRIRVFIPGVP